MRSVMLTFIRGYQWLLRPLMGPSCRFYPSCSCYAHEAITRYGAWRGLGMTLSRLSRCHPWHEGGYDPVAPTANELTELANASQPNPPIQRLN